MRSTRILLISLFVISLSGCSKEPPMTPSEVNTWIYKTTADNYLWSNQIPTSQSVDYTLSAKGFFEQLRLQPNVDGNYGDRFSQLMPNDPSSRALTPKRKDGFGFEPRFLIPMLGNVASCQVLYTIPKSPAYRANLKRGEYINKINNNPISSYSLNEAMEIFSTSAQVTLELDSDTKPTSPRTVTLNRESYDVNPIAKDTVYSDKVAYLCYTSFTPGVNEIFNTSLKNIFANYRNQGVEDIILDLRYNAGGELNTAVVLGSLLTRSSALGDVMLYRESNKTKGDPQRFEAVNFLTTASVKSSNSDPKRLVILTSSITASASELIIHCLKPYFGDNLIVVGSTTRGKNLGGIEFTSGRHNWTLYLMTFRTYNRDKVSGYEDGIQPTYTNSEGSYLAPFGDRASDPLLHSALYLLGKETEESPSMPNRSLDRMNLREVINIPVIPMLARVPAVGN